ncbi:MAG: hypothetical protein FGM57_02660 [Candidatus Taylorbacteria bacterium]|nr:hypothetical protein [Candidatus Taylorbacteria bacterium]
MKKETLSILVGISLPFLLILGVAGYVLFGSKIPNPQHDFVFMTEDYSYCTTYEFNLVLNKDGKLEKTKAVVDPVKLSPCGTELQVKKEAQDVYRYNFKNDTVEKVTSQDLDLLTIKQGASPDGYVVSFTRGYDYMSGPEIFFGTRPEGFYLKKGEKVRKINSSTFNESARPHNFRMIGWVINE